MVNVPCNHFVAVTPSDSQNLPDFDGSGMTTKRLWIGVGGVVALVEGGKPQDNPAPVNFTVVAGQELIVAIRRVNFINTTASGIVAGYVI